MATKKGNQIIVNVYVDTDQYEHLKELSGATGAPMAHWIRRGINKVLAENGFPGYDNPRFGARPRSKK